jgi:transcriptional regulator with XRE-family HTH domain
MKRSFLTIGRHIARPATKGATIMSATLSRREFGVAAAAIAVGATMPAQASVDTLKGMVGAGARVKAARIANGWSINETIDRCHDFPITVAEWQAFENGDDDLDFFQAINAMRQLGVPPFWIFAGGNRLESAREAKKLTVEQCCEAIGASPTAWPAWVADATKIPMTPGRKLCDLLGVSFRWLACMDKFA